MKIDNLLKSLPALWPNLPVGAVRRVESGTRSPALLITVKTPAGRPLPLYLETRVAAAPSQILSSIQQLKAAAQQHRGSYPVLASSFFSPRVRELCRQANIGYVDLAGNSYLQFDGVYVERTVEHNPFPRRGRPPSLFSPVSSRLIRALLEEPTRQWGVSELAAAAKVSVGQTSHVCHRLIEEAYATRAKRDFRLTQPSKLLDAWREVDMMSRTGQAAFYSFERDPERLIHRVAEVAGQQNLRYALTSFAAAMLVAPFVRGIGSVQWYIDGPGAEQAWIEAMELRPVESGPNVMLLTPYDAGVFAHRQTIEGVELVGTVQLYVDLYQEPARGREQAEFLRQERLTF